MTHGQTNIKILWRCLVRILNCSFGCCGRHLFFDFGITLRAGILVFIFQLFCIFLRLQLLAEYQFPSKSNTSTVRFRSIHAVEYETWCLVGCDACVVIQVYRNEEVMRPSSM